MEEMPALLRNMLLEHQSKQQSDRIVEYIGNDKRRFAELMNCLFGKESMLSQRAAGPMGKIVQRHPEIIQPYLSKLVKLLAKKGQKDVILRNSVRLLQFAEMPVKLHGSVMNSCFSFVVTPDTPVAVKAFSLSVLQRMAKIYPGIEPELRLVIEERWENETAAFHARAKKIIKQLN